MRKNKFPIYFSPMDFFEELVTEDEKLEVLKLSLEDLYINSYGKLEKDGTINIVFQRIVEGNFIQKFSKTMRHEEVERKITSEKRM